jgi:hypothetical protein
MRRAAVMVPLAVLVVASAASASGTTITSASIGGAKLGLGAAAYKQRFGRPVRTDALRFPKDWTRLVFTKRKVGVYLNPAGKGIEIATWNNRDRTAAGVGPCTSISRLKAAYGKRLKRDEPNTVGPRNHPRIYGWTVGKLIFAATGHDPKPGPSKHVTAVALYAGPLNMAGFLALQNEVSVIRCS